MKGLINSEFINRFICNFANAVLLTIYFRLCTSKVFFNRNDWSVYRGLDIIVGRYAIVFLFGSRHNRDMHKIRSIRGPHKLRHLSVDPLNAVPHAEYRFVDSLRRRLVTRTSRLRLVLLLLLVRPLLVVSSVERELSRRKRGQRGSVIQ